MEFGDLRQACHEAPGATAFARVQVALGRLFARDPLGASEQALPYAREQLARWPDMARWIEFGDATDPRLIPRDPRQLGLARALVFSSKHGVLDREGHARQEHLLSVVESGAVGPMELACLEITLTSGTSGASLLWALLGAKELTRLTAVTFVGRQPSLLASLAATRHARGIEQITFSGSAREVWSANDFRVEQELSQHFPMLRELVHGSEASLEREALEPDEERVTSEVVRRLAARAEREGACRVRIRRSACDDEAYAALRASGIPYVEVDRGRGY